MTSRGRPNAGSRGVRSLRVLRGDVAVRERGDERFSRDPYRRGGNGKGDGNALPRHEDNVFRFRDQGRLHRENAPPCRISFLLYGYFMRARQEAGDEGAARDEAARVPYRFAVQEDLGVARHAFEVAAAGLPDREGLGVEPPTVRIEQNAPSRDQEEDDKGVENDPSRRKRHLLFQNEYSIL